MSTPAIETPGSTLGLLSTPLATHRLHGKVAIITGAGGNIGIETAGRFLREGANVVLVDISPMALDMAVEVLKGALVTGESASSRIYCVVTDAATEDGVKQFIASTLRIWHRIDIAFLNAGILPKASRITETDEEEYEELMRVNVKSAFLGIKHVGLAMREGKRGGSIVLTSSTAGLRATPDQGLYSASKFALRGLALTAASELGPHGIRVNTIHPSDVDTPQLRNTWEQDKLDELQAKIPLGRFTQVDDIGSVVAFLASEDSKFITGSFLKIDGGSVSF
ncbi:unnamed protein product [Periconia digitata]|uniref:NAD(P)-binding protein n=1 Tax=Periconia digitata TaxID=1303443 RepID=A0A9W4XX40_9PLEO|nr:unnamed protein product [Periconia digitata]